MSDTPTCEMRFPFRTQAKCSEPVALVVGVRFPCCDFQRIVKMCELCWVNHAPNGTCVHCKRQCTPIVSEPVRLKVPA